ncbi:exodeoxyribonuclease VII large subunit [compost metagenome]
MEQGIAAQQLFLREVLDTALRTTTSRLEIQDERLRMLRTILQQLDPQTVLQRGYALLRGTQAVGEVIEIETATAIMKAKVEAYDTK